MKNDNTEAKTVRTVLDDLPAGRPDAAALTGRVGRAVTPEGVTKKRLYQDVIIIALPSLVEFVLTQLTSMADQIMVGHLPG